MADLPRLSLIAVIPRDSGAGRVRIGRDGEAIVSYALGGDARGSQQGSTAPDASWPPQEQEEIFTAHGRIQHWAEGFPAGAYRFGAARGSLYSFHLMGSARMGASPETSRPIPPARPGTCATSSSPTARPFRPRPASTR